jgi:transcriptional regulator with XRE-family HTH domain
MSAETFGQRLKRLREAKGIGVRALAREAGIASHASISQAEAGRGWFRIPGPEITIPLAKALGVPHEVLIGQDRLIAESHAPYMSDAAVLLRFGATIVPDEEAEPALDEFAASARTGRGNLIPQNYDDMRPERKGKRKPKPEPTTFKLRVSGNCMGETVKDGEVVWFDTTLPREPVALVFAVRDDHEAHIKRLIWRDGAKWLESDDGWSVPLDESWRVLAVGFTAQRALPIG